MAAFKKNISFTVIVLEIVCALLCLSAYLLNLLHIINVDEFLKYFSNGTVKFVMIGLFLSLFDIPILLKIYFKAKDELDYDEFGVMKLDKHKLGYEQRMQIELRKMEEMERVISKETLKRIVHSGSKNPEKDIEKLTGLDEIKTKVSDMQARMEFAGKSKNKLNADSGNHMVFYGPPGTGKTTVARIITGILWDYEYIKDNKIVEIDGNFLKSQTPSDSAIKTKAVINAAKGGVLFIDEAYALMTDKYGVSVIATLIKEMEDHRDEFVLILAGYVNEMDALLSVNTGFKSRIKDYIYFNDYTKQELVSIFINMARDKGFEVDDSVIIPLSDVLEYERGQDTWGNARTVRNILDKVVDKHAVRFIKEKLPKTEKYVLKAEDF